MSKDEKPEIRGESYSPIDVLGQTDDLKVHEKVDEITQMITDALNEFATREETTDLQFMQVLSILIRVLPNGSFFTLARNLTLDTPCEKAQIYAFMQVCKDELLNAIDKGMSVCVETYAKQGTFEGMLQEMEAFDEKKDATIN